MVKNKREGPADKGLAFQEPDLLRRLLRAKDRMDRAPDEDWPIRRLAEVGCVCEPHFARSFKQAFGVPPHRYLLTRRVERALALLRETELPITEIAFRTRWTSLGTFGRVFKDVTGQNPAVVRCLRAFVCSSSPTCAKHAKPPARAETDLPLRVGSGPSRRMQAIPVAKLARERGVA